MTKISEHAGEDEGEGDDCVGGRVQLQIVGNTVRIYNALEDTCELVGLVVCRWSFICVKDVKNGLDCAAVLLHSPFQS